METQTYEITINAPRETVWEILWGEGTYPEWTSPFSPDSQVKTDNWQEGSNVRFIDGSGQGMVAEIARNIPNAFMSFRHIGIIGVDGKEDFESEDVKAWAGAMENYTLESENGRTHLTVVIDVEDSYKEMFDEAFPKALQKVKELAQQ